MFFKPKKGSQAIKEFIQAISFCYLYKFQVHFDVLFESSFSKFLTLSFLSTFVISFSNKTKKQSTKSLSHTFARIQITAFSDVNILYLKLVFPIAKSLTFALNVLNL